MDKDTMIQELLVLNEYEQFLKNYLEKNPDMGQNVIGLSGNPELEFEHLRHVLEKEWKKGTHDSPFFLTDVSYYLNEDEFVPKDKHVNVIKNLRYFPLTLHSHQFIEVNFILKSGGSFIIGPDRAVPLSDGDVILSPPGYLHCFKAQNEASIIIDFIIRVTTFDTVFFNLLNGKNYLSSLFLNTLYNPSNGFIMWHCQEDAQLEEIVLRAYKENQNTEKYSDKLVELLVMEFFVLLLRKYEDVAEFSTPYLGNSDKNFQALFNYMQSHYQTISLTELAMKFNYSERQLIRVLKKQSGKNFSELLLDIRMRKALELLKDLSIPVSKIASMLGYSSNSYFTKVFTKTFTFTPEQFRERIRTRHPDRQNPL